MRLASASLLRSAPPRQQLIGQHAVACWSRSATSLPQIPGVIQTNREIADDLLVSRIRRWVATSPALRSGAFDLLQLAESSDGRLVPRAICGLLRTKLSLAEGGEPVKAMVTVFYRARDYLNREFWEDQARRLSDILAEEYLGGERGVHLMVHHNAPSWPLGLEMSDHRLLVDLEVLHVLGNPLRSSSARPELVTGEHSSEPGSASAIAGHASVHRLLVSAAQAAEDLVVADGSPRGHYILRDSAGAAICGLEVLGCLSSQVVCGAAWAAEGCEAEFGKLADAIRCQSGRPMCSIVADPRDARWQRVCGAAAAPLKGLWRARKRLGVAVTGTPVGLKAEDQVRLARAPFAVPWEFVPFHFGSFVVI